MGDLPRYIALQGYPKCGKSTAQTILERDYGVIPVDDGRPLRDFLVKNFGASERQVSTQDGKKEEITVIDRAWEVRKALGELGNALEAKFGPHVMPFMAHQIVKDQPGSFSFGSVRRNQAGFYKAVAETLVIGIDNPNAHPTGNEFDTFDPMLVDVWIRNDGLYNGMPPEMAMADLATKLCFVLHDYRRNKTSNA